MRASAADQLRQPLSPYTAANRGGGRAGWSVTTPPADTGLSGGPSPARAWVVQCNGAGNGVCKEPAQAETLPGCQAAAL
jgi:hypothetical protein